MWIEEKRRKLRLHEKTVRSLEFYLKNLRHIPLHLFLASRFINSKTQVKSVYYIHNYIPKTPIQKQVFNLNFIKLTPPKQGVKISRRCWISEQDYRAHSDFITYIKTKTKFSPCNAIKCYNLILQHLKEGYTRIPQEINRRYGGSLTSFVYKYIIHLTEPRD